MKTIRIFISSPGDVAEERERAKRVVEGLRKRYAGRLTLETVLWEELPLTATMTFQDGIEKVILAENSGIDVAVFVLWSRLGSPLGSGFLKRDGSAYRSGTEREFDLMFSAYEQSGHTRPQIFAYVRQDQDGFIEAQRGKNIAALSEMVRQREMVESFIREEFHDPETGTNLRAYHTFPQPSTFAVRLRQHLRALLDEMAAEAGVPVDQQWEDEPYLGLRAFDLQHAPIFFGREQETATVLEALQQQQRSACAFVLVVGGSGSGKSSLVRAGVIPDLIESGDEENISWRRAMLTPGECTGGLLPGLVRALLAKDAIPELREDGGSLQELSEDFASAPVQAAKQVRRALQRVSTDSMATHLVLLVDQFEELFTHAAFSESAIQAFVEALKALAESTRVSILATVRSDFYGHCQQVPALMAMKSPAGQIDLMPLAPTALARIIGRPAHMAGLCFEENARTGETLDQRILADVGNNSEVLPLVEFVLSQLYLYRTPQGFLTYKAYAQMGGIEGAVAATAEKVFSDVDATAQQSLRHLLPLLAQTSTSSNHFCRRYCCTRDYQHISGAGTMVDALVCARLLVSDTAATGARIAVSHEALLSEWPRAKSILLETKERIAKRDYILNEMARWLNSGEQPQYLLPEARFTMVDDAILAGHLQLDDQLECYLVQSECHAYTRGRRWKWFWLLLSNVSCTIFLVLVVGHCDDPIVYLGGVGFSQLVTLPFSFSLLQSYFPASRMVRYLQRAGFSLVYGVPLIALVFYVFKQDGVYPADVWPAYIILSIGAYHCSKGLCEIIRYRRLSMHRGWRAGSSRKHEWRALYLLPVLVLLIFVIKSVLIYLAGGVIYEIIMGIWSMFHPRTIIIGYDCASHIMSLRT